jgi:transposase
LRVGYDLLAQVARLANGRCLDAAAPCAARPPGQGQRDRLEPGLRRQRIVPGQKGGEATGPNPTDRGRSGSKRHLLVDGNGIPLALLLTPANRNDSKLLEPLIEAVWPIRQGFGRPRKRPDRLHADKGYDFAHCRRTLRRRKIVPRIARRGIKRSDKLGRYRWVIERTLAWFSRFRRLTVRYERRLDILTGFQLLAASLICLKFVTRWFC